MTQQWAPIETAPKDGTPLLAWRRSKTGRTPMTPAVVVWFDGTGWSSIGGYMGNSPIYWQHLPEPPP